MTLRTWSRDSLGNSGAKRSRALWVKGLLRRRWCGFDFQIDYDRIGIRYGDQPGRAANLANVVALKF